MTITDDFQIDFSGLTHDHTPSEGNSGQARSSRCSTIAILRRHPMYDCLVLVKKYRGCLDGYVLEFPESESCDSPEQVDTEEASKNQENQELDQEPTRSQCHGHKLISRFLDGDDPIYNQPLVGQAEGLVAESPVSSMRRRPTSDFLAGLVSTFGRQTDDRGSTEELVHVPINGLLDRLKNYTQSGLAVDGRVYAFAMGLKTAERFLVSSAMHELQETPI